MLDIFAKKSLIENKKLFLAMISLFTITIVLFTLSVYSICYGVLNYNQYAKNVNLEDFQMITYEKLSNYDLSYLENKYGLILEQRLKYVYKFSDDYQITIFPEFEDSSISKPVITEGFGNVDQGEIVISQEFAKANNISLGQHVTISNKKFKVVGFASFPNLMYPIKDGGLFPSNQKVGEVYISQEDYNLILDSTHYYVGKFNEKKTKAQREATYEELEQYETFETYKTNIVNAPIIPLEEITTSNIITILDKDENFQLNVISLEYRFLGVIIGGLSIVIGIIAMILTSFIFDSLIKKKRRDIGIIRAQGYSIKEITNAFTKYFTNGIVISVILGVIIGSALSIGLELVYSSFFNILYYKIDGLLFIILVMGIFIFLLAFYSFVNLFFKTKINKDILKLINNVDQEILPKKSQKPSRLKFSTKMKLNTITRHKQKTMLLIYGVFFSSVLFIFGMSAISSFLNMEENVRGPYFTYDYDLVHSPEYQPIKEDLTSSSTISFYANINKVNNSILTNTDIVKVFGISDNNEYIDIGINELKDNEVIITSSLKKDFGLNVGDEFQIVNPTNSDEVYSFEVAKVIDIDYENTIYANLDYLRDKIGLEDYYYNGVVGRGELNQELEKDKNARYYSYDDLIDGVKEYSAMSAIGILYIACIAGFISLITMISITSIIINSRRKQISIMKVLGYNSKEINKFTFSLYKWVVIITYIISYPLSIFGVKAYINLIMSFVPNMEYPLVIKASIYQFILGLIFILSLYYISSFLVTRKINKIKLSESLNRDE